MKKSKKFLSMLLAISMILAMSATAFAAEPAAKLSAHAGETVDIGVTIVHNDGTIEETVAYVDIPHNATVAMEDALTSAAAKNAAGISGKTFSPRATSFDQSLGSGTAHLQVSNPTSTTNVKVGEGTLQEDCDYLEIKFTDVDPGIKKINVRMENTHWTAANPNLNCFDTWSVVVSRHTCTATFYEGQNYPVGNPSAVCRLWKGDYIKVYASVGEGTQGDANYSTGVYFL